MTNRPLTETHEIIVLLRNKNTGQESWMKFENVYDGEISTDLHFDYPEPIDYYGGILKAYPNPHVTGLDFSISGKARTYSLALDTETYHYDKGFQDGNQP